jgi:hypothetical protein
MKQDPRHLIESQSAECVVAGLGLPCQVTYGEPTENSAVRYDFDFSHAIARFTWWSDASYFSEALAIDGQQIMSKYGLATEALSATIAIRELLEATRHAA